MRIFFPENLKKPHILDEIDKKYRIKMSFLVSSTKYDTIRVIYKYVR